MAIPQPCCPSCGTYSSVEFWKTDRFSTEGNYKSLLVYSFRCKVPGCCTEFCMRERTNRTDIEEIIAEIKERVDAFRM